MKTTQLTPISGRKQWVRHLVIVTVLLGVITSPLWACPPNPTLSEQIENEDVSLPYYLQHKHENRDRGIGNVQKSSSFSQTNYSGTFNALAVLVEFSDKPAQATATGFDTLLFVNQVGSFRHYFNEVSYGNFDVVTVNLPSQIGWITAPQTYAYYCNNANGTGSYPNNSQKLCEDIVHLIDPVVDFSNYDNDNDGTVDGVILIHTGPGAEMTGQNSDIWSHMWAIPTFTQLDGKRIFTYSIQPEYWFDPGDMTCGVICHEFGHILGLPDLYDRTPSGSADSYGVGSWSIMAYGSWNGSYLHHNGHYYYSGNSPAHFDPWSRIELGFAVESTLTTNVTGLNIPDVENGGDIFKIPLDDGPGNEYFLIENRQPEGYDAYLPGDGLMIWHIDETQSDNDDRWYPGYTLSGNFMVALEQADGNYDLEQKNDQGDSGDPFPGISNTTTFSPLTDPSSNPYSGDNSGVVISNISSSSATMTADIQVSLSSGTDDENDNPVTVPTGFVLEQNYPNPFNPKTRISLELLSSSHVQLNIYDLLGRKINTLADDDYPAGNLSVDWDGKDANGKDMASGVYFYEVISDDNVETRKMVLLR